MLTKTFSTRGHIPTQEEIEAHFASLPFPLCDRTLSNEETGVILILQHLGEDANTIEKLKSYCSESISVITRIVNKLIIKGYISRSENGILTVIEP